MVGNDKKEKSLVESSISYPVCESGPRMLTEADDIIRFLDTGFSVILFKNRLGTYSAELLVKTGDFVPEEELDFKGSFVTDANTPTKALFELSQKIINRA